ncbi:MAG: ABC transporter substrate-binding protein [Arthrobacter sp.]
MSAPKRYTRRKPASDLQGGRKMKRNMAGFGAAAALVSLILSGCSTAGNAGGSGGEKTVTFFASTNNKDATEKEIAAFNKKYPDISIKASYFGIGDGQAALATQLAAGTAPDIITMIPGSGTSNSAQQMASRGYLADLSGRPWADRVNPGDKTSLGLNGKLYGAPQTALGAGYIYSQSIMDASGLTPPKTWSEVQPFCEAAAAKGTPAYAIGLQTGWTTILIPYALTATLVYGPQPDFTDQQKAGKATFSDSKWMDAYNMYAQMNTWKCFQPSPNGTTYENSLSLVATGKALGVVQMPSSLNTLNKSAPKGTVWKMAPLPATDNPDDTVLPSAVITTFGLNAKASGNDAALKFLDFLASDEAIQIQADTAGGIPAVDIAGYKPSSPAVQTVIDYRKSGKIYPFIDNLWPNPTVQQDMISGLQGIFASVDSPAGVLKKMDAAFAKGS